MPGCQLFLGSEFGSCRGEPPAAGVQHPAFRGRGTAGVRVCFLIHALSTGTSARPTPGRSTWSCFSFCHSTLHAVLAPQDGAAQQQDSERDVERCQETDTQPHQQRQQGALRHLAHDRVSAVHAHLGGFAVVPLVNSHYAGTRAGREGGELEEESRKERRQHARRTSKAHQGDESRFKHQLVQAAASDLFLKLSKVGLAHRLIMTHSGAFLKGCWRALHRSLGVGSCWGEGY